MDRIYSTAEICDMFNISKSTLLRWEREDWLSPVPRDTRNERQYESKHIREIGRHLNKEKSRKATKAGDIVRQSEIDELSNLYKFVCDRDVTQLRHLQYLSLHDQTIKHLLRIALDEYEPNDETFHEIISTVKGQIDRRFGSLVPQPAGWSGRNV